MDGLTSSFATVTSILKWSNSRPRLDTHRESFSIRTCEMAVLPTVSMRPELAFRVQWLPAVARSGTSITREDVDVVINSVNDYPQLLRCDSQMGNHWIKVRTIGTKSNRSGIGARLKCITRVAGETKPHQQIDEVRSGGSYISQNDLRVHFGLGKAEKVELLEIRWPSGQTDTLKDIKSNQLLYVKEGEGLVRTVQFESLKKAKG